jgi:uncharacterized protein
VLLIAVVFLMRMINLHFTPERTRALPAGRTDAVANAMAASPGTVTPFFPCSLLPGGPQHV